MRAQIHKDFLEVECLSVSMDGKNIAAGHRNGDISVWHLGDSLPMFILPGHHDKVLALRFIRSDSGIISVGMDSCFRWWDIASGEELQTWSRRWSDQPDGSDISDDGGIALYITPRHLFMLNLKNESGITINYAFRRNYERGFVVDPDTSTVVLLANKHKRDCVLEFGKFRDRNRNKRKHCPGKVTVLGVSRPANLIAAGNSKGKILIVDFKTKKTVEKIKLKKTQIIDICFSKDARYMAFLASDSSVCVYQTSGWNKTVLPMHGLKPTAIVFSADSRQLIVGLANGSILGVKNPF